MRIIGLDIGERRVGVAVSDPDERVASPVAVIDASTLSGREVLRLVEEYEAGLVVVGVPVSLDGTEGPQAARIRRVAATLAEELPVPVEYHDERLSTAEARRSMRAAGLDDRKQRGAIDKVAAAIVLQSYLDARRRVGGGETVDERE